MPAEIVGLGVAVPPYVLTNADLEELVDTNDQWITERTGIKERRIAGKDDSTALLGKRAAEQALRVAGIGVDEVDLVMVATATPDYTLPSAACILQLELGMTRGAAMDVIAGCSGFVYALATASQFVDSGAAETALVVGSETLSRISDYTDRGTCILFGDGAGAVVLRRARPGCGRSRSAPTGAVAAAHDPGGRVAVPGQQPDRGRAAALHRHGGPRGLQGRGDGDGRLQPGGDRAVRPQPTTSTWSSPTRPTSGSSRPPPGGSRSP